MSMFNHDECVCEIDADNNIFVCILCATEAVFSKPVDPPGNFLLVLPEASFIETEMKEIQLEQGTGPKQVRLVK